MAREHCCRHRRVSRHGVDRTQEKQLKPSSLPERRQGVRVAQSLGWVGSVGRH